MKRVMLWVALIWSGCVFADNGSNVIRVDVRNSFGGWLATGVEMIGEADGSDVSECDTTKFPDTWIVIHSGSTSLDMCILNGPRVVGGRLYEDEAWTKNQVYVVRDNIVVPSGVTLTIGDGCVVKFTEGAGLYCEEGGAIVIDGGILADISDDEVDGDTNLNWDMTTPSGQQWWLSGIGDDQIVSVTFARNVNEIETTRLYAKGQLMAGMPKATRLGYNFDGWYTAMSGGAKITANTKATVDATYYARWLPNSYVVRLHRNNSANDGATAGRALTYDKARALPKIADELKWAPRSGYTFLGWATSASATTAKYTDGQSVKNLTAANGATVHLYAVWKQNAAQTYIVRLHRNNSERDGSTAGRTYTIGKARALPKMQNELKWAPRKGYDFLGWSKSATATTATYTDGQSLKDLTTTAGATVHLYGVWKAHHYIVRLHRNNSKNDGATTGRAFDYDQVRFLPTMAEINWARSGYMFLGWSLAQSSTTVKYADGLNVFNLSANDGEELHVWGVWKKAEANAYLLRLHRNNSERDGATAGRQLKLNTNRKLPTVKELGWSRTDATFKGWATTAKNAAAGKVAYKDGATVTNLVKTQGDTAHIYAVWQ